MKTAEASPPRAGLSLFWRTFVLLGLLLLVSMLAWLQTLRSIEFAPRAQQTAQQLASQVNLSRAALIHADAIARISLLRTMSDEEGLQIIPKEASDTIQTAQSDALLRDMAEALQDRLGKKTVVAKEVNGKAGLWVAFDIDGDEYWLLTDLDRLTPTAGRAWIIWLLAATALSLVGAALLAGLINRPLQRLSFAASRVQEGDFDNSQLDESVRTSEIRDVNIGFNRMAQKLAQLDQERAVMLAGISHDLRTPLARLRLEAELSVADPVARDAMASDIDQLDAIIDKFLDYARPQGEPPQAVVLADVLRRCLQPLQAHKDIAVDCRVADTVCALADPTDLYRVLTNLLENARKYGKTPGTERADVDISSEPLGPGWVLLVLRDHGPGVATGQLAKLTQPFFRGESARTAANGAGLGLAIVEKTLQRSGGDLYLENHPDGGLCITLRLKAPAA